MSNSAWFETVPGTFNLEIPGDGLILLACEDCFEVWSTTANMLHYDTAPSLADAKQCAERWYEKTHHKTLFEWEDGALKTISYCLKTTLSGSRFILVVTPTHWSGMPDGTLAGYKSEIVTGGMDEAKHKAEAWYTQNFVQGIERNA